MPTDDERREVAARLRGMDDYAIPVEIVRTCLGLKTGEAMHSEDRRRLSDRIADLIEPSCDTREDAISAWNRRAERTCRNVEEETDENNFNEEGFFLCSECGEHTKLDWAWHGDVDELRYCARCGAKVVSDDADR